MGKKVLARKSNLSTEAPEKSPSRNVWIFLCLARPGAFLFKEVA